MFDVAGCLPELILLAWGLGLIIILCHHHRNKAVGPIMDDFVLLLHSYDLFAKK